MAQEDTPAAVTAGRRRAGDPRLSPEGKELFRRMTTGDLAEEFQAALDADVNTDPLLGGHPGDDD